MKTYKAYQIVVIVVGLLLCFFGRFIPLSPTLSASGTQVLLIMAGGLLMWLFVGVDWTSMAVILALALVPELGMNKVAAGSIGNSTVFFLMLCFMLSKSLENTGVARRLAVTLLTNEFSRKGAWNTIAMIFLAIFILSSGLSSTVTVMIFLPIFYEIFKSLDFKQSDGYAFPALMVSSLAIICQVAQATTPISHAMTLIGFAAFNSYTGHPLDFGQYVMVAMPVGLLVVVIWFIACKLIWRPDISRITKLDYDGLRGDLGPMSKEEKIAAIVYLIVVVFWIAPGISKYVCPPIYPLLSKIQQCYPPIIALILLHFIKVDNKSVLSYKDAIKGVPLSTIIFMGAILELGSGFAMKDIGVGAWLSTVIGSLCSGISPVMFIIIMGCASVILTNFMSNAVTCAICMAIAMPLVATIYQGLINPATIATMITMGISFAYATPPATPPVAVVADSGWISMGNLFIYGMVAAVISMLVMTLIGLPLANAVF